MRKISELFFFSSKKSYEYFFRRGISYVEEKKTLMAEVIIPGSARIIIVEYLLGKSRPM